MERDRFDIAVVGAGPAGSIAALAATRRGWRVGLIDQRTFPRDKACGDGLGPGVAGVLDRLGLHQVLDGETAAEGIVIHGPNGAVLRSGMPTLAGAPLAGYVIAREDFDARLQRAALDAGAVDLTGHKLVALHSTGDRRRLAVRRTGQRGPQSTATETVLDCSLVVGADGAYSTVRRLLGVARNRPRHLAVAMRAYAKSDAFESGGAIGHRLLFEFSQPLLPAYGWVFPAGGGTVNVGVGVMLSTLRRRQFRLRGLLDQFVSTIRDRGIEIGEPTRHLSHHLPTAGSVPPLTHPRTVLVGDAASMINPVSGEGIVYGMTAAARLVELLPADLASGRSLASGLTEFERWFRRRYRAHLRSSELAHRLLAHPWWAASVIRAASRDGRVLDDALSLLFGMDRIHLGTVARILRHGR